MINAFFVGLETFDVVSFTLVDQVPVSINGPGGYIHVHLSVFGDQIPPAGSADNLVALIFPMLVVLGVVQNSLEVFIVKVANPLEYVSVVVVVPVDYADAFVFVLDGESEAVAIAVGVFGVIAVDGLVFVVSWKESLLGKNLAWRDVIQAEERLMALVVESTATADVEVKD